MGHLVLFPRFQEVNRTRPADATANAERLVKAALAELAGDAEAKPRPAANLPSSAIRRRPDRREFAADAKAEGLPDAVDSSSR